MATNLPSCFFIQFLEQLLKFLVNFTLLKYVKSQRSYGFLITKELIFVFQILDLKDHFSASLSLFSERIILILQLFTVPIVLIPFKLVIEPPCNTIIIETSSHFGYTSDEQGAMVNPAYCELEGELTLRREIRGQSVDSNYDVPRSLTDLAAAGPGEEPIMQKMSFANKPDTRDHSNSVYDVPRSQSDHEVGEIMRKRYVSTKDVKKLSTIKREGLTKSNDENVSKMSASTPELLNWAGTVTFLYLMNICTVSQKVTEFQIEITLEIFCLKNQFR